MARLTILLILAFTGFASAPLCAQVQKQVLAQEYLKMGEYEKAALLYEELRREQPRSTAFYRPLFTCLLNLEDYKGLEKLVKAELKRNPEGLQYRVDLGYIAYRSGDPEGAAAAYEKALDDMGASRSQAIQLAAAFSQINEYAYAVKTYEKARRLIPEYRFNNELANLYYRQGDIPAMIDAYLDFLAEDMRNMETVQTNLQRYLDDEADFETLQGQLYARIQRDPNDLRYPELLIWNFVQLGDFSSALIQVKALDRRFKENGLRVFELGQSAKTESAWDAAIEAFSYLVDKGPTNVYYYSARNALIDCRRERILADNDYRDEDLFQLKADYEGFLRDYNRQDQRSAAVQRELANLEAFYLHDLDGAVERLRLLLEWPALRGGDKESAKLDLGDYYLMQGEIWEATLLYSQVDKRMKDEPLGEEARFRNARLSYYRGDFEWSQAQLDVLKASTSELVANDALNLSVFITENLGLDTTSVHLQRYARADLLAYQNRDDEALAVLDSLAGNPASAMLQDDVLMLQARIALKRRQWSVAADKLNQIAESYAYDILADDAIFELAQLCERRLDDPERAMNLYERLMIEHKDSVYVVEARKRFRALRGDDLN